MPLCGQLLLLLMLLTATELLLLLLLILLLQIIAFDWLIDQKLELGISLLGKRQEVQ